jgi:hypothetical protein
MNRYLLGLPVCLVVTPLLLYLLLHGSSSEPAAIQEKHVPEVSRTDSLPDGMRMEQLARENPREFLKNCIRRYDRNVNSYRLTMLKREQIAGRLQPQERMEVYFKDDPHSVCMIWHEGARKAERVLYVKGENNDKMLARPNGSIQRRLVGDIVERDVDGPDARQSGRFPLSKFGLKKSLERALAAWEDAWEKGTLRVKYLGTEPLPQANDRICYHLHRVAETPEDDGVMEQRLFIDQENWLPLRILSTGEEGKIIGEYYFLDIQVNPEFKPDQFKPAALKP